MNSLKKSAHVISRRLRKLVYSKTGFDFKNGFLPEPLAQGKYFLNFGSQDYLGIDARGEWEKNRFQELLPKGIVFLKTGDKKFVEEITGSIIAWIAANPAGYGINWLCAMEVGVRAANWLLAYDLLKGHAKFESDFLKTFSAGIDEHRRYIEQNLEVTVKSPLANHYLSDIAGLLYIAILHPFKKNKALLKTAVRELEDQMQNQVMPDGVSFENSIAYHRYVLEIFLYSAIICRQKNIHLSTEYWQKLEKMLEFVMYYTRPDSLSPNFGDSDDGMWHVFSHEMQRDITDHRYLLSLAAILFKRPDFKSASSGFQPEFSYFFKEYSEERWNEIPDRAEPLGSRAFKNGGVYVMREGDAYSCVMTANSHENPVQLHKHNDIGSFELCAGDAPFIVDAGTYCYTAEPEARERFRSTASHNTVRIDGEEQQDMKAMGFFALPRTANVKCENWESNNSKDLLKFSWMQFLKSGEQVEIAREFLFKKEEKAWTLSDSFTGTGEHSFEWFFHLHPDAEVFLKEAGAEISLRGKKLFITAPQKFEIRPTEISFAYGHKQGSKVLTLLKKSAVPFSVFFKIQVTQ
jgi:hypothetical protein